MGLTWQRVGQQREEPAEKPSGEQQTDRRADAGQRELFDQQLPDQLSTTRANRASDGELLAPRRAAHEQEIRDVDARDQEDHRDRAEQHEQRAPDIAHVVVLQRKHQHVPAGAALRVALRDVSGDGVDVRPRPLHRNAWLEASDARQIVTAHTEALFRGEGHRHPHLGLLRRELEPGGHHAHDGDRLLVETHHPANRIGATAEAPLPRAIREQGHRRRARRVVGVRQAATARRG